MTQFQYLNQLDSKTHALHYYAILLQGDHT